MNTTIDNYLFLGLPKSGKTTFFSLVAQHLQNVANRTKYLRFLFLPTKIINKQTGKEIYKQITSDFIDDCISRIHEQRWPRKTEDYESGYSFEIDKFFTLAGDEPQRSSPATTSQKPDVDSKNIHGNGVFKRKTILQNFFYRKAVIDYHDYPGEAFEAAFGVAENPTPVMLKAAEDMKSRIITASGLFLILDADILFNGTDNDKYKKTLTALFFLIRENNPSVKIAIIFNKLELFYGKEPNFVERIKNEFGNVYASLPSNHRFFYVYPLGSVYTDEDGSTFPPKELKSRGILKPLKWMINF